MDHSLLRPKRVNLTALLGGLVLVASLTGSEARAIQPGLHLQQAPESRPTSIALQAELTARPVWREFLEHHGEWSVLWDEATTLPRRVLSRGYELLTPFSSRDDALAATRSFVDQNSSLFGLYPEDLQLSYAEPTNKEWVIVYRQHLNGVPVVDGTVTFFVSFEGKLPMIETHKIMPGLTVETTPILTAPVARDTFVSAMLPSGIPAGASLVEDDPELVILGTGTSRRPRLAWKIGLLLNEIPHHFVGYLDAQSGDILHWSDEIYHIDVTGRVDGRAHQDHPDTPVTVQDMPNIRVQVQGGNSAFADDNGDFVVPHGGSSPVNVTVSVEGRWARVDNVRGGEISDTATLTPGVSGSIRLNPSSNAEFTLAQVDAYLQTTKVHNYFKTVLPDATGVDCQFVANVNINSSCNAFFNGSSTNYFNRAGACNNTAFASVVAHELGHEIDFKYGGILDGGLSEGFGDILSMYMLGYPTIGPFFFTGGSGIRTGTNGRVFPGNECGGQVHCLGEIWMGFAWKARQAMISELGGAAGRDAAEQAVLPTFVGNPASLPDAVIQTFIFDDDNGDLSDGTPNFDQLESAAACKRFDIPAPPVLTSVNPTNLGLCSGTQVTLHGEFFLRGMAGNEVRVGGQSAQVLEVNRGAGFIRAALPDLSPGNYDVSVSTPFGSSNLTNAVVVDSTSEVVLESFLIGRPSDILVCGPAGADYFLAASLQEGNLTFEGAQLGLGPRLFIVSNSFSGPNDPLDSSGETEIRILVPDNRNLTFVSPYFQAAIRNGSNWTVTDVERATIFP